MDHFDKIRSTGKLLRTLLVSNAEAETTRCQIITSMLLAEWQAKGTWAPGCPPSFLLVNAGADPDPCLRLPRASFGSDLPVRNFKPPSDDPLSLSPEQAMVHMNRIIAEAATAAKSPIPPNCYSTDQTAANRRWWNLSQKALYGSTTTAFYGCQHPDYGLASTPRGHTSLWVESRADLSRLQADLRDDTSSYWQPWGYNTQYRRVPMITSVMGSISAVQWTAKLVEDVVVNCAPLVFLPHVAPATTLLLSETDCSIMLGMSGNEYACPSKGMVVPAPQNLPNFYRPYERLLRCRLQNLPTDYEFYIMSLIRQLHSMTVALVSKLTVALPDQEKLEWALKLTALTYDAVLRGITFGIEALVFHGWGLPIAGDARVTTTKFLGLIREQGSCSRRDLLRRFQTVDADQRDEILTQIEQEGLINSTGTQVEAVSCRQFFNSLPNRPFMPRPLSWDEIQVPLPEPPRRKPKIPQKS